jgi:5-hydroxyisourate hydrolase-like protein (transthyretin family)
MEEAMPGVMTVLLSDWMYGQPIAGASVWLYGHDSQVITKGISDDTGRCALVVSEQARGVIRRLVADIDPYFAGLGIESAYSDVTLTFRSHAAEILLILAPSGYTAYVGRLPTGTPDSPNTVPGMEEIATERALS